MNRPVALEMKNISKRFGSVIANHNVSLEVYHGEILAILGENGCGKTTQIKLLDEYLRSKGYKTLLTREPGSKGLGIKLREILLNYDGDVSPTCESFLFLADRAQHVDCIIH